MSETKFKILFLFVLVSVVAGAAAYTYNTVWTTRYQENAGRFITVMGYARQNVQPDSAAFSFSVSAENSDVTVANKTVTDAIAATTAFLREQGVAPEDMQSMAYDVSPQYETPLCDMDGYCPKGKQIGAIVNHTIAVEIHDISKADMLVTGLLSRGATHVSNLTFGIDALDKKRQGVQEEALKDAQQKAEKIAQTLGVHLKRVSSYYQEPYYNVEQPYASPLMRLADGKVESPTVYPGKNDIESTVSITYEME